MGFINWSETIVRKANGDILTFYIKDKNLFLREFKYKDKLNNSNQIISNVFDNEFDIKIDDTDKIYGICVIENGEVAYLYTDKDNNIKHRKLFDYDNKRYVLKYPYIKKIDLSIHIIYYIQDISDNRIWSIINHYFDGSSWIESNIDFIVSFPIINSFIITCKNNMLNIFYLNLIGGIEEVFFSRFSPLTKEWSKPLQITNTNNKKIYLNVLQDEMNFYHITWSEFVNENLVVKYTNCYLKEDMLDKTNIISLSDPSNCSFPTIIKTGETLWDIWVQMNKLYRSYSFDYGKTWSKASVDSESIDIDFIRYRFISNNYDDLINFKLCNTFGTIYPKISFIGFKNIKRI